MEIAGCSRTDKRFLSVLVIVPTSLPCDVVPDIDRDICQGLVIVVLQRSKRLKAIELRRLAADARDTVPSHDRYSGNWHEGHGTHAVMRLARIDSVGEKRIAVVVITVGYATAGICNDG